MPNQPIRHTFLRNPANTDQHTGPPCAGAHSNMALIKRHEEARLINVFRLSPNTLWTITRVFVADILREQQNKTKFSENIHVTKWLAKCAIGPSDFMASLHERSKLALALE